jgi:hypothetical protein
MSGYRFVRFGHATAARRTTKRPDCPYLVWMLIVAILAGGVPMLGGFAISNDSQPAFTLDICHPGGGASYNLSQAEPPLLPAHSTALPPCESGAAAAPIAAFSPRPNEAPDPPPPKIGA